MLVTTQVAVSIECGICLEARLSEGRARDDPFEFQANVVYVTSPKPARAT